MAILLEGNNNGLIDRISNLHDEILCHIISYLPNKDAITTTILSRRWENLWAKSIPLQFNDLFFFINWRFADDRLSENDSENDYEITLPYFIKFVNKVLSLRENDESIKKFELDLTQSYENSVISSWIQWAISRNVQNLDISTCHRNIHDPLFPPSCVLDCKQLINLRLSGRFLIDYQNSKISFPNLKSIYVSNVTFGDELQISNLLSSSPFLEEIEISNLIITRGSLESRNVCISAPKLRRLEIRSRYHITFVNYNFRVCAPLLSHLGFTLNQFNNIVIESSPSKVVEVVVYIDVHVAIKIRQLVDVISHAKELGLFFQDSHLVSPALKLPVLRNLKTLRTQIDPHEQQFFSHVLESAPNLKHFIIHLKSCTMNDCSESHCTLSSSVPHCVATCLESIEIRCTQVMKLIGFFEGFLKYANVLKKMKITRFCSDLEREPGVLEELYKLPRASTACQIQLVF